MGQKSLEFVRGTFSIPLSVKSAIQIRDVPPPLYRFHAVNARRTGTYARRFPSGEYAPSKPRGSGNRSSNPPSTGTSNISAKAEYAVRGDENSTFFPSDDQPRT